MFMKDIYVHERYWIALIAVPGSQSGPCISILRRMGQAGRSACRKASRCQDSMELRRMGQAGRSARPKAFRCQGSMELRRIGQAAHLPA